MIFNNIQHIVMNIGSLSWYIEHHHVEWLKTHTLCPSLLI